MVIGDCFKPQMYTIFLQAHNLTEEAAILKQESTMKFDEKVLTCMPISIDNLVR